MSAEESETPRDLTAVASEGHAGASCNLALFGTAGRKDTKDSSSLTSIVYGLNIFSYCAVCFEQGSIESWLEQLQKWPNTTPMFIEDFVQFLAALPFAAVLSDRDAHVSKVQTKNDIQLICSSKYRGLKVTCPASVLNLYCRNLFRCRVEGPAS